MHLSLTHFESAVVFSLFASIVLGIVTKRSDRERVRYGVRCFAYFVGSLFVVGWLMYLGHG